MFQQTFGLNWLLSEAVVPLTPKQMTTLVSSSDVLNTGNWFLDNLIIGVEYVVLFTRMLLSYIPAIFRVIIPRQQRCVKGEIVLITGTGHGIGAAMAEIYGRLGAIVVCLDINEANNDATVLKIRQNGGTAYGYVCDITNRDQVMAVRDKVVAEIGKVTILVNNAGILTAQKILKQDEQTVRRQFDINIISHFWTIQAFLPDMKAMNSGHIVAISSVIGLCRGGNACGYGATKYAVRGLMESLHQELAVEGYSIKLTTAYPFYADTGLCKKSTIRRLSIMKLLKAEEVASAVVAAQRRGLKEFSAPSICFYYACLLRVMPQEASDLHFGYVNCVVVPEDECSSTTSQSQIK